MDCLLQRKSFGPYGFPQFGESVEQIGKTAVVATAGVVLSPQFGSGFATGVEKSLRAVFHHEADFCAIANSVCPKPEIVRGGGECKGFLIVQHIGMETMGREKNAVSTAKRMIECRAGIGGIPLPRGERSGIPIGVKDNRCNPARLD